ATMRARNLPEQSSLPHASRATCSRHNRVTRRAMAPAATAAQLRHSTNLLALSAFVRRASFGQARSCCSLIAWTLPEPKFALHSLSGEVTMLPRAVRIYINPSEDHDNEISRRTKHSGNDETGAADAGKDGARNGRNAR